MAIESSFTKNINKKDIIFCINKSVLDDEIIQEILSSILHHKKVALDMKQVETIDSKLFIDCLLKKRFKLFNLNSKLLAYISLILNQGFLYSFMNYSDFSKNKRELFSRRLKVV